MVAIFNDVVVIEESVVFIESFTGTAWVVVKDSPLVVEDISFGEENSEINHISDVILDDEMLWEVASMDGCIAGVMLIAALVDESVTKS